MTTYTTIPNSSLEPGKPIRSIDGLALRDNPISMFEGDATAPKLADAALSTTATNAGRDWILARTALLAIGSVGSYAFLSPPSGTSAVSYAPNSTASGSNLRYAGSLSYSSDGTVGGSLSSTAPAGTWRCLGSCGRYYYYDPCSGHTTITTTASVWVRIS